QVIVTDGPEHVLFGLEGRDGDPIKEIAQHLFMCGPGQNTDTMPAQCAMQRLRETALLAHDEAGGELEVRAREIESCPVFRGDRETGDDGLTFPAFQCVVQLFERQSLDLAAALDAKL